MLAHVSAPTLTNADTYNVSKYAKDDIEMYNMNHNQNDRMAVISL